jgi:hypothetical protein
MLRSTFGSASLWGTLALLAASGTASAQWLPFGGGNSCNCGARSTAMAPPMFQSASTASYSAAYTADAVQCGQPVACTIEQPVTAQVRAVAPMVQAVRVEALQPVVHPVYDTVHVTEYQQVKQKVQRPVIETKWVDQAVTEMRPVTQQRTVNVPTVDYQTVTEYRKVQKQVGYWTTKTEATGKVAPCQYDNRPGMAGWFNRTSYSMRTAFVPPTRTSRQFVPQTMTCTVPCTKKVAVPGMKQVTYNVTSMVPQQTTRKVAVNTVRYEEQEITAMKPVTVARTMQVGTRISYAPAGTGVASNPGTSGPTALTPTPDNNASAKKPNATPSRTANGDGNDLQPSDFNNRPNLRSSYVPDNNTTPANLINTEHAEVRSEVIPTRSAMKTPSVVRVSQWVARTPIPSSIQLSGQPSKMDIADTAR